MSEENAVTRYTTGARINHWITAVSLILLAPVSYTHLTLPTTERV